MILAALHDLALAGRVRTVSGREPGHGRPHRVLIADDHAVVREGLRAMLATQSDLDVIAEADVAGALSAARRRWSR